MTTKLSRILIIGATSAIAQATARLFAAEGAQLYLVGRDPLRIAAAAADLRVRGATEVATATLDANDISHHAEVLDAAWSQWRGFDAVLVAHGVLPNQQQSQASVEVALASFDTNARSTIAVLTDLANRFEAQGAGVIAAISSPAGGRGRASNYVYGAAKGALAIFLSGLRQRLHARGVRVLTILPGFVDTPMTISFKKGPLWSSPEKVAAGIKQSMYSGFGEIYVPSYWRWIMAVIKMIPERLFVRVKI